MNIPGTKLFSFGLYINQKLEVGDILSVMSSDEVMRVIEVKDEMEYTIEEILTGEEFEIAFSHYNFLKKHKII